MRKLLSDPPVAELSSKLTRNEEKVYYFPSVCEGLQKVSDQCYTNRLSDCYDHDLEYHMAFLLEDLKVTGITLSSHMITAVKLNKNETVTVDVADCPLFQNDVGGGYDRAIIAVVVSLLASVLLLNVLYFVVVRFRLIPKIRARFVENTPYEDIVITEQSNARNHQPDGDNFAIRRQVEDNNAALSTLSREIETRQKNSEMMVNTFGPPEDEFAASTST